MKMSALLLVILFGLAAAEKPVTGYGIPKPSETYAPQRVPSYVLTERPTPSKSEEIKAKISSKGDAIYTKLEELKPKIEEFKENLKAKIPTVKSTISGKISDFKSKFESKHTQSEHHVPRYVLVRVQPTYTERPKPSKFEEISSKKDAIHTQLEELKPKIEDKIYSIKEAISTKVEALRPKIEALKENFKAKIPTVKSTISDKISDFKSKFESKHTQSEHHGPSYVLVRAQPKSKHSW